LYDYADALRRVGRRSEALSIYELLSNKPVPESKSWLVFLFLGETLSEAGRYAEAEAAFRTAVDLKPGTTVTWVYLAGALANQEKFEDAIQVLHNGLAVPGDHDEVLLNLALNLRTLGRLEDAAERLERALKLNPDYDEAREVLEDVRKACAIRKCGNQ
jgi:tetratricopeptide (TPR) repeat protein